GLDINRRIDVGTTQAPAATSTGPGLVRAGRLRGLAKDRVRSDTTRAPPAGLVATERRPVGTSRRRCGRCDATNPPVDAAAYLAPAPPADLRPSRAEPPAGPTGEDAARRFGSPRPNPIVGRFP